MFRIKGEATELYSNANKYIEISYFLIHLLHKLLVLKSFLLWLFIAISEYIISNLLFKFSYMKNDWLMHSNISVM